MMSKQSIIHWLEENISRAPTQVPCVDGMMATLHYLRESNTADAKSAEVKIVSKGEIDETVDRWEGWIRDQQGHFDFSPYSYMADELRKLINYVKTAALMPKEPSEEVSSVMFSAWHRQFYPDSDGSPTHRQQQGISRIYDALYNHFTTPPKPKMKTMWYLAYRYNDRSFINEFNSEEDAKRNAEITTSDPAYTRVSPIWTQEVPA